MIKSRCHSKNCPHSCEVCALFALYRTRKNNDQCILCEYTPMGGYAQICNNCWFHATYDDIIEYRKLASEI